MRPPVEMSRGTRVTSLGACDQDGHPELRDPTTGDQGAGDCALICSTCADFMSRGSPLHTRTCGVCAEVCELCAKSCEALGADATMKACAEACRACAASCLRMSRMSTAA